MIIWVGASGSITIQFEKFLQPHRLIPGGVVLLKEVNKMKSMNSSVVELQLGTVSTVMDVTDIVDVIEIVYNTADKVCTSISSALAPISDYVKSIYREVSMLSDALLDLVDSTAGTELVVGDMQNSGCITDGFVAIYDGIMRFVDSIDMAEKSSGKLQTLFEELVTAPSILNMMNSLF